MLLSEKHFTDYLVTRLICTSKMKLQVLNSKPVWSFCLKPYSGMKTKTKEVTESLRFFSVSLKGYLVRSTGSINQVAQ